MDTATTRPSVFISYSRKDSKWLDELTTMLAPVVRAEIASVWWDKKIKPSQVWRQEIDTALASARLSILLVSSHFLASDFIQNEELPFLIDAARHRGVKLLWILVSPCLYEHSPLRDLQAAHDLSQPLSKLRRAARQEVLASISRAVVAALDPKALPSQSTEASVTPALGRTQARVKPLEPLRQLEEKGLSGRSIQQTASDGATQIGEVHGNVYFGRLFSAAPEPRYEDDRTRELGEQLAAAQRQFKELSIAGQDVADVREQILGLRRSLRDGERLKAGDWLGEGRFQLLETAGRGGFATVWKAWDEERQALVAVKVLHGLHAEDHTRRERFFRGARKMAELHHPGIVRVIEAELEENGKHFFVMEYVGGGDLRQAVLAGELPQEKVMPVILAVGEALAYAHEKGIIHRDVKPANILLDGDRPKLTDFDLIRAFDTTGGTQTQGFLGTVLYAAPEMLGDTKNASAAADVYSLAMTAVFAFHGKDLPPDVWRRPEAFLEKLPCSPALREALGRGISWEPEYRPGSVAELCEEMRRAAAVPVAGKERQGEARARSREPAAGEERLHEVDGTVLLYVPGGEYTLGAEDLDDIAKPVHRVVLSPFWIAKHPVTNEQYGRFLEANPGASKPEYWPDQRFSQPQQPVVVVSWKEAQAYCRWAGLRLPSEAQWEAAARGTDQRRYPWGNAEPTPELANFGREKGSPTPVGSHPKGAGPFGALDQAGNVWEWCEDVWDKAAYRMRNGQRDPVPTTGETAVRCLRGGSWHFDARFLAAAYRARNWASYRDGYIGFRCMSPAVPEP